MEEGEEGEEGSADCGEEVGGSLGVFPAAFFEEGHGEEDA